MKRYWLFVYPMYYPMGGMEDFKGSFDTINDSIQELNNMNLQKDTHEFHILDSVECKIVSTSNEHCQWSNLK
jgi:peptide subunit release factor RF-3